MYAAGKEIRAGDEGICASDWGNKTFVAAAQTKASGLLTTASEKSESDMGDRIESVFNTSFWAKDRRRHRLVLTGL